MKNVVPWKHIEDWLQEGGSKRYVDVIVWAYIGLFSIRKFVLNTEDHTGPVHCGGIQTVYLNRRLNIGIGTILLRLHELQPSNVIVVVSKRHQGN